MADLTTTDGLQFHFTPDAVDAVMDHNPLTSQAVTSVHGISTSWLTIAETVDGFLTRIGVIANFATLTRPDGRPVWLNAKAVKSLRSPLPGEYIDGVNSVIACGNLTQGVEEAPEDAKNVINSHGGKL